MLIDFHTHAFPEKIAVRAIQKLAHDAGGLTPQTDGTLGSLKAQMDRDGVDISVVHSIATNPKQQTNVNNFAMEIDRDPAFVAFGSVHPDAPDALSELERIKAAGLKGVKLHPEYQQFYADVRKNEAHLQEDFRTGPHHHLPRRLRLRLSSPLPLHAGASFECAEVV